MNNLTGTNNMMNANLILIRGLCGSGKSTLAKKLSVAENGKHLEADMYFVNEKGEYIFDASRLHRAHVWCQTETFYALLANKPVYVSNTFTTLKELRPYFEIALAFDITPTVITMNNQWGNVHNVPEDKLLVMKNRFVHDLSSLFEEHSKNLHNKYPQNF